MIVGKTERLAGTSLTYATLTVLTVFCLFPFLWMVDTAFKPVEEIRSVAPSFFIANPTLENFRHVLVDSPFVAYFRNSAIVAAFATLLTLIVSTFSSYALSRWPKLPASRTVGAALLVSQMIPGVLLLVPIYVVMRTLDLLSTYASLIIVYCTFMIPLATFMLKGFFDAVPGEIEEAAEIDGCGRIGFIWRVLLPLSVPGIVATGAFAFVAAWNEFMFGYVLINDDARRTLTPGIMIFKGSHVTDWGGLMAASVLAVVPVALCFVYIQRFLAGGLSAGAVKG
jgi:multiple sugar transport system permease protein